MAAAVSETAFRADMVRALDPQMSMYRVRDSPDGALTLFAGLWSTWWVNEENCMAKVVLATVPEAAGKAVVKQPLQSLPWIILQLQTLGQDSPAWADLCIALQPEFRAAKVDPTVLHRDRSLSSKPPRQGNTADSLTFDPTQETHAVRQWAQPDLLDAVVVRLVDEPGKDRPAAGPRPSDVANRTRVEYSIEGVPGVRLFVEKAAARQPLRRRMQEASGLKREGTLLAAANEWCTWFLLTAAPPSPAAEKGQ